MQTMISKYNLCPGTSSKISFLQTRLGLDLDIKFHAIYLEVLNRLILFFISTYIALSILTSKITGLCLPGICSFTVSQICHLFLKGYISGQGIVKSQTILISICADMIIVLTWFLSVTNVYWLQILNYLSNIICIWIHVQQMILRQIWQNIYPICIQSVYIPNYNPS